MPGFQGVYTRASSWISSLNTHFSLSGGYESYISYSKVCFKFKWGENVDNQDRHPVDYLLLYIPEDDPETEEVDESEQVEFVKSISWDGQSSESGSFTIDPAAISSSKVGSGTAIALVLGFGLFYRLKR